MIDWGQTTEDSPHQVTLTRGLFLGRYEVTWTQYDRFCAETERRALTPQDRVGDPRAGRRQRGRVEVRHAEDPVPRR